MVGVLMCGSDLSVGGGVVSVIKNYLDYGNWDDYKIDYVPTHINGSSVKKIIYFIKALFVILGKLMFGKISIVHLHMCDGGPFYRKSIIMVLSRLFRKKIILHHHTDYTEFFSSLNNKKTKFVRYILRSADINIALGNNLVRVIEEFEPTAKVRVLYNAVQTYSQNQYNMDGKYIMFLGWLLERKGLFELLQSIKELDDTIDSNYKLVLCGLGDQEIREKIDNMRINHRIEHIGWVDKNQKENFFKNTIVNVLPSYREGLPMTILETMAYGIPNIASNISTIPEVIRHNHNGILVEPHDVETLKKMLLEIIYNREYRYMLSKNAYETVDKTFSINKHIMCLKSYYKDVCNGREDG